MDIVGRGSGTRVRFSEGPSGEGLDAGTAVMEVPMGLHTDIMAIYDEDGIHWKDGPNGKLYDS
jgi:hypothetical protein